MCPIDEVKDPSLKPIMWCKGNVDRKFTLRSEDPVDHVSPTFVVEYDIIFFWALKEIYPKIHNNIDILRVANKIIMWREKKSLTTVS